MVLLATRKLILSLSLSLSVPPSALRHERIYAERGVLEFRRARETHAAIISEFSSACSLQRPKRLNSSNLGQTKSAADFRAIKTPGRSMSNTPRSGRETNSSADSKPTSMRSAIMPSAEKVLNSSVNPSPPWNCGSLSWCRIPDSSVHSKDLSSNILKLISPGKCSIVSPEPETGTEITANPPGFRIFRRTF